MDLIMFKEQGDTEPLNLGTGNSKYKLLNIGEAAEFLGIKNTH
jgi:hypothetical protein